MLAVLCVVFVTSTSRAADADFNRDVLPILSANCFPCHGPDASKRKADLRLDTRDGAVGSKSIVPGKPDRSELIARLTADDAQGRMPPPKVATRLKPDQVQILRDWVERGATYDEHWAFRSPRKPAVPTVGVPAVKLANPIDAFVRVRLEKAGLKPASAASREAILRRATLDLTGLLPSPEEVEAFLKDTAPDAWEKVVERLLASPHYGERWGRHWLDVARFADSGGFETDIFYGSAWRYRDYVIRSFNADKPFDRFVKEQLAGDELFPNDRDALVATSLFAVGPILQEAGMVKGQLDYDWLTDSVDTTGSGFLGLTVGCARCHDHKYDPISQKEYFGLQAVFATSDLFDFKGDGTPLREHVALKKTEAEFELARKKVAPKKQPGDFDEYPEIPLRGLWPRSALLEVRLLKRGELIAPGEIVEAALPARLGLVPGRVPAVKARAALAEWVASKQNPLTARVIVNRVWQWHFGEGLARTPNDFGVRGERPTHPELLDWLACELMDPTQPPPPGGEGEKDKDRALSLPSFSGKGAGGLASSKPWSLKHIHRLILLSDTYQMSSTASAETLRRDPDNRLLSRFQPRRGEAEVVWDAMRVAAGTLDRRMYGLPVFPPLDARELIGNYKKWPAGAPEDANRRAVYVVARRSFRFPALGAFDPPENATSCGQRDRTVVANQALALLNHRSVRELAGRFAERLLRETDRSPEAIATRAWLVAYGRPISADERVGAVAFLRAREKAATGAADARQRAVTDLCVALFNTNEFIYLP